MKVLLINSGYPPQGRGGTELHAHHLARGLIRRGHQVSVFHRQVDKYRPDYWTCRTKVDGVPVTRVNYLQRDAASLRWMFENPRLDEILVELLDQERPDIVHVYHLSGLSTSMLERVRQRGIPLVMTLMDCWMVCPRGQRITAEFEICNRLDRRRCVGCLQRLWPHFAGEIDLDSLIRLDRDLLARLRCCDLLIAPTRFHRRRMLEIDLAPDKVKVIPLGIDAENIPPRRQVRFPPRRIGYIGSVIPTKGVHVLIEAFNRLGRSDLECHIHGPNLPFHDDCGYLSRLRSQADAHLTFHFHGPYDPDQLPDILESLDVVVVPSLWWETYAITVREAMVAGVPVVASDLGALREALAETMPELLFRTGDAAHLADKLRALMADKELYWRASQLRDQADRLDGVIDEIENCYRRLTGSGCQGGEQTGVDAAESAPRVTVLIPTFNGGALLKRVLQAVLAQKAPFPFEVLCIDSGSRDGTLEAIRAHPEVRLIEIPKSTFNHGLTRNLGVREARGKVVALLTQDAEPIGADWLQTLVDNFEDPEVVGAYCRQIPREGCNPFQKDRLRGWAQGNLSQKKRLDGAERWNVMGPHDRLRLIAFDNVASCVRKSVVERLPFEECAFGEDLGWSRRVLQAGHAVVMDPRAAVVHSHNRSILYEFKRVCLDHRNLRALVGLQTVPTLGKVFTSSWHYWRHLVTVVRRDQRGLAYRLWWMAKAPVFAFTQNLAQYLGARSSVRKEFHAKPQSRKERKVKK